MEDTLSLVHLPTELIFQIVSDFEFDVRHVLKLRAINKSHYEAYNLENILKLYKRYPQPTVVELEKGKTYFTPFNRGLNELLLEYAKQLAITMTWPQVRSKVEEYGTYKGAYDMHIISTWTAVRSKNRNYLTECMMDHEHIDSVKKRHMTWKMYKCAVEPNDEEYTKFIFAHPLVASYLNEARISSKHIRYLIEGYIEVIKEKPIKMEIVAQILALFSPEDLASNYHWIHLITHKKFDMNLINGAMAYLSPPIQIIYKSQIKNCPDCLYSALCSNSFANLIAFYDSYELPTHKAYFINAPISPNGLEWLIENIRVDANGTRRGLEFLTGDSETEKRVLMKSLLHSIDRKKGALFINYEHLEVFSKLADLGLTLSVCPDSWRKILVNFGLCMRDISKIIEVVWLKFPGVIRELLPKILVWSMDHPFLELVAHEIIQRSPNSILKDLHGNNSGYTLLHGFANSLKLAPNTPQQVLKVIDFISISNGVDLNAVDREGRTFYDYFQNVWYHNVPMENIILLEGLLDRGLRFCMGPGRWVSPYWFNPTFALDNQTRCISMTIKLRPKKYRCMTTLSFEFFEGEIADLQLEATFIWHKLKIHNIEPRYVHVELIPGEYYFRWIINLQPVVDPNLPIVFSKDGQQYNILIVSEDVEENMIM